MIGISAVVGGNAVLPLAVVVPLAVLLLLTNLGDGGSGWRGGARAGELYTRGGASLDAMLFDQKRISSPEM